MKRKEFIKTCGIGCLSLMSGASLLAGCVGTRHINIPISDSFLLIPLSEFFNEKKENYRKYIIVQNEELSYPICVYRFSENEYTAIWMRCTHQGTELQAYGDRLQCPAHGSEFSNTGALQNGPADQPLRTFPVTADLNQIKIDLR